MASPVTPFVAVKAFMGQPLEDLDVNKSPVETIFHAVCLFNKSTRQGAHHIGVNRDAFRNNVQFATEKGSQFLRMAGFGLQYLMATAQTMQAGTAEVQITDSDTSDNHRKNPKTKGLLNIGDWVFLVKISSDITSQKEEIGDFDLMV